MYRIVSSTRKAVHCELRWVVADGKEVVLCSMDFDNLTADVHVVWTVDAREVPVYTRILEVFKFLKLVKSLRHE